MDPKSQGSPASMAASDRNIKHGLLRSGDPDFGALFIRERETHNCLAEEKKETGTSVNVRPRTHAINDDESSGEEASEQLPNRLLKFFARK